jgi:nudix-type nucleoside diphosphatase (YffH/AdpP family)
MTRKPNQDAPLLRDLEEKVLVSDKYSYSSVTYQLQRADGRWEPHLRSLFRRPDAVTVLPYDAARGKVLLTRQYRLGAYMNDRSASLLEACAGTLDPGEKPEDCMRREALEEMGLKVGDARFLFEAFVSPAATTEKLYFFVAPYAPEARVAAGGGLEDEGEDIEVIEADFVDVVAQGERGEIRDAKTLLLLYWLKASGLMGG